jgi:hypothetical protein
MSRRCFMAALVVATVILVSSRIPASIGQEKDKDKNASLTLPPYLEGIVTKPQQQQIHSIQEKYAKQTADLQAQIDAANKQCDTEIESLLNASQKAKAKKAREELASKAKAPAEEKPVATRTKSTTFSGYAKSLMAH